MQPCASGRVFCDNAVQCQPRCCTPGACLASLGPPAEQRDQVLAAHGCAPTHTRCSARAHLFYERARIEREHVHNCLQCKGSATAPAALRLSFVAQAKRRACSTPLGFCHKRQAECSRCSGVLQARRLACATKGKRSAAGAPVEPHHWRQLCVLSLYPCGARREGAPVQTFACARVHSHALWPMFFCGGCLHCVHVCIAGLT